MRLDQVGTMRQFLAQSPIAFDLLWNEDVSRVTAARLTLFRARMAALGLSNLVDEAVNELLNQTALQVLAGKIAPPPYLKASRVEQRFMADELVDGLRAMSDTRAQAVLLALEECKSPDWACNLSWKQVLRWSPSSALSAAVIRNRNVCRHIKLGYVFWEFVGRGIAAPVLHLEATARIAFQMEWFELQFAYKNMVMVDRQADDESLRLFLRAS